MPDLRTDLLADFKTRFRYVRDTQGDRWTLLDAPTRIVQGDCEDYALTALWMLADRSWWNFWRMIWRRDAEIWFTKFHGTGEGHVTLWVAGFGWTDSYHREWSIAAKHPPLKRYGPLKLALTLILK